MAIARLTAGEGLRLLAKKLGLKPDDYMDAQALYKAVLRKVEELKEKANGGA